MGLFTFNDNDTTATRYRHDNDNRQTERIRACGDVSVPCLPGSLNRLPVTAVSQLLIFSLLKADHVSLIMNTEQLIELVSVNPPLYDLSQKYSDVKLK
jgi:hypothetical protein